MFQGIFKSAINDANKNYIFGTGSIPIQVKTAQLATFADGTTKQQGYQVAEVNKLISTMLTGWDANGNKPKSMSDNYLELILSSDNGFVVKKRLQFPHIIAWKDDSTPYNIADVYKEFSIDNWLKADDFENPDITLVVEPTDEILTTSTATPPEATTEQSGRFYLYYRNLPVGVNRIHIDFHIKTKTEPIDFDLEVVDGLSWKDAQTILSTNKQAKINVLLSTAKDVYKYTGAEGNFDEITMHEWSALYQQIISLNPSNKFTHDLYFYIYDESELNTKLTELNAKVGYLSEEVSKLIGGDNKQIDLSILESQSLIVNGDTNKWEYGGSHYVVEVNAGEVYELKTATSGYSRICKLSEHNPIAGGDATAFNFFVSSPNNTYTITIDDGQHYLYFTKKPASLILKGADGVIPALSERVAIIERDIESIYDNQARDERMNDFDWKPFDKPYFVFQLDDSNKNVIGHTDVFLEENVPLCYAAIPSNIDNTKLAKMREMVVAGGEVLCHYSGSPSDETPFSNWLNLIRTNLFALQDFGFKVRGLIRADSTQANSVNGEKICRRYFDYANNGMGAATSKQYNINYWGLWNTTKEQVKAKFDADANVNGIHIYSYHGKGGISAETWQDEAAMRELLQYIKTNHSNVVFTTYGSIFDSFKTTRIDNIINNL